MIICLEGIDAAGKGTHTALLAERMSAKLWKFPNRETQTGKLIYQHLEERWWLDANVGEGPDLRNGSLERAEALVFQALQLANRMEVASEIFQAAAKGSVVFDRYWPAGYAYGRAEGLDGEYLINLHRWLPQPDLFILLDIDPSDSIQRRPERRDRYEKQEGLLGTVAGHYRELWVRQRHEAPLRWVTVDARGSHEDTASQIHRAVAALREHLAK